MNTGWACLWTKRKSVLMKMDNFKHTTASRTGMKILAVLRLDVTSVNRAEIITTMDITATRGILAKKRSSCATVFDKPEV